MPFEDLDRMGLREFVRQERSENAFCLFMHIPKTAGSSFSEALRQLIVPYNNVQVDYKDTSKSHNEKLTAAVDEFLSLPNVSDFRSASGHLPFDLISKIDAKFKETKLVTFLRDPVSRIVSDYRYQRTPEHPPYLDFIEKFPKIEDYIDSAESQNKIARFIRGRGVPLDISIILDRIDKDFSFVGLLEMYPMSYNVMFSIFGDPNQFPSIHARKTPDNAVTKVDITKDIKIRILKNNEYDIEIFNHVSKRLIKHRDHWAEIVKLKPGQDWAYDKI